MKSRERHEIKENELMVIFRKIVNFFEDYQKEVLYVGIGVLAIVLIYFGLLIYNFYKLSSQNKAFNKELKLIEEGAKNRDAVLKMAKKGGVAAYGIFALSEDYLKKGEYDKAYKLIKEIKKSSGKINYLKAEAIKIQIMYAKKEYEKIINLYRGKLKMILKENKEFPSDVILFYIANAYEQKGDIDSARKIWEKIKEEFPYSSYGIAAAKKIISLQ